MVGSRRRCVRPAFLGLVLGLSFGLWNLIWTQLYPRAEDTAGALLAFYGPMFAAWAVTSFFATRRTGRIWEGIKAGAVVAFATFCVLDLLVIVRANVFLNELSGRSDWRALMTRFQGSDFERLRVYINYHYLSQAPFKILVASRGMKPTRRWSRRARSLCDHVTAARLIRALCRLELFVVNQAQVEN
jgi:hypothetical protein